MSTLLSVSNFLGGRSRERRRVNSTGKLAPVKTLGSANDVVPEGTPKNPPSKLSNVISSTFVSSPLSTFKARRTRTDSILESSSDANSLSQSSYLRTPLDESLPSNANATSGSARNPDVEEKLRQSRMHNAELDRAQKRAQDLEAERDQALFHARDAREQAQMQIRELEDALKSKSQTLDTLIISSEELQSQIDTLKTDLQQAMSVSKTVEEERDKAFTHARKAKDAYATAQSHIQVLEDDLTRKSEAVDKLTTDTDRMQTQIDALTTNVLHSTGAYKDSQLHVRELEDAQTTTSVRIQELEDDIKSTKAELSSNAEALVALTASSGVSQSKIDVLAIDLRNSIVTSKNLEEERDRAQLRASELEKAQTTAMARIQELEGDLVSAGEELSSKIQENAGLIASAAALQSQIGVLTADLRMRIEELDQEHTHIQVLAREGEEHRASAQKHARDLEDQLDDVIISAQGANDALVKAQARIQELEDALRSTKSELGSKIQAFDALTAGSEARQLQIDALKSDLQDTLAVRKDIEAERDSALVRACASEDAHKKAQARIQAMGKTLQSTKAEVRSKSKEIEGFTTSSKALQSEIDTLKSALHDALAVSKLREEERDNAKKQEAAQRKIAEEEAETLKVVMKKREEERNKLEVAEVARLRAERKAVERLREEKEAAAAAVADAKHMKEAEAAARRQAREKERQEAMEKARLQAQREEEAEARRAVRAAKATAGRNRSLPPGAEYLDITESGNASLRAGSPPPSKMEKKNDVGFQTVSSRGGASQGVRRPRRGGQP
ncbi:hypothetical protein BDN70DRAFT_896671 [Pholiota conissans]|uniref:Uncharacterized protein n=1 Tax=Pholiota conissans TaxID=109636 RepID=A0A9P6CY77_9AGAR|nr:hypothetical protein BDN70DRAFT_896671 [Pholiota conissans]